jgi:hypothetical protein
MDMEAARVRFGSILEWALAAAFVVAVLAAGSILVRELSSVRAVVPVIAGDARIYYDAPPGIPSRAVSVPLLLLGNGHELRVGDRASEVVARLGTAVTVLSESVERSVVRERLTRFYSDVGVQFAVVFEAFERNTEPRVAAIYLR